MKSKHRHQLQTNELSRLLAELKSWWGRYGTAVSWGLVLVLAVALGVTLWERSSKATRVEAWSAFVVAQTPEDLEHVAADYAGSEVAAWAKLHAAERRLAEGLPLMYTDRAAGKAELQAAEQTLQQLAADSELPDAVRERALFLLGKVRETLSDGNLQPAIEAYEQFLQQFPNSILRPRAQERLEVLKTGRAQAFYSWFAKQNPKPADLKKPKDLGQAGSSSDQETVSPSQSERSQAEKGEQAASQTSSEASTGPKLIFPTSPKQEQGASDTTNAEETSGVEKGRGESGGTKKNAQNENGKGGTELERSAPQKSGPAEGAASGGKAGGASSESVPSEQAKPDAGSRTGAAQPGAPKAETGHDRSTDKAGNSAAENSNKAKK